MCPRMNPPDEHTHTMIITDAPAEGARVLAMWEGGFASHDLSPGERLVVGRALECDIVVTHTSASRRHAVTPGGPPVLIEDLGSSKGTRIDNRKLPPNERTRLAWGTPAYVGRALLVVQPPPSAE